MGFKDLTESLSLFLEVLNRINDVVFPFAAILGVLEADVRLDTQKFIEAL